MANAEPGLSIEEKRRLEYEAAHGLARDYYSGGQAVGSLLLTFSVAVFVASAGLLEEVAPLQATDLDPVLFAGWGVLGAAMLLSLGFMVAGRYSQKRYIQFLWLQAQALTTDAAELEKIKTREAAAKLKETNPKEAADLHKKKDMYTKMDASRKWSSRIAIVRDFFLGLNILALLAALLLLGSFAALAPESGGDEGGGGPPQRDFIIEDIEFPEVLEPADKCLATIDLVLESPSTSFTIYPVFDDQPSANPQRVRDLERAEPVGAPTSVCVRTPPDFPFHEPMDPLNIEILVDMGEEILFPEPVPGLLPEIRTSAEYAILHEWTPPPP